MKKDSTVNALLTITFQKMQERLQPLIDVYERGGGHAEMVEAAKKLAASMTPEQVASTLHGMALLIAIPAEDEE